jgi:hypothetical protein
MNTHKQRLPAGVKRARIHNPPEFPLGLPGERKRNMATKKKRKSGGKKRNTSASVRQSQSVARKTAKKNPARRKSASRKRNPLSVGGIKPLELVAAGAGAIVSEVGLSIIRAFAPNLVQPGSWAEIGVQLGEAVIVRKFWPKGFYPDAASIGAGAPAVSKGINKLTNFQGILTGFTQNLLPAPQPANAGMGRAPQSRVLQFR